VNTYLLEPIPYLFERLRIWPFHTVRSVGKAQGAFSGRTLCQLAPQKDDYQSAILIMVFLGVPNPYSLEKTVARLEQTVSSCLGFV